jgi:hypothetical protein
MLSEVLQLYSRRSEFYVPAQHLNNTALIDLRVQDVPADSQSALRLVLSYLYLENGPTNLRKPQYLKAEPYLMPYEVILSRYLKSRTNGTGRRAYGKPALLHMRKAGYKCECCGFQDVRALNLDHVYGKGEQVFLLLCANCHNIKSREFDWLGKKRLTDSSQSAFEV